MTLETFTHTLGNAYLQRHLLAVQANTLEEAVRAGNEFLRIRNTGDRGHSGTTVRMVKEEGEEATAQVAEDPLTSILHKLTEAVEKLQPRDRRTPGPRDSGSRERTSCWKCGKEGHVQRNCPMNARSQQNQPASENGVGPQQ